MVNCPTGTSTPYEKDIRDYKQQISTMEDGLCGNWPSGFDQAQAKERIAHGNNKIQELGDLKHRS